MAGFAVWAAVRTVKSKIGTWTGYSLYSQLDPSLTKGQWAEAIGTARSALAARVEEITRPLNRRPVGSEIEQVSTKKATGYRQAVEVYVRDRDTGLIESRYFNVAGRDLVSRQKAVNEALTKYREASASSPEDYPEEILGAAYTGTFLMKPRG